MSLIRRWQAAILTFSLFFTSNAYSMMKGNSAWLYGKEQSWVMQIQNFNAQKQDDHRINYLFPETGVVHVDSIHSHLLIAYDPSVTRFYKKRLKNVKIIPDLSFWVAHTNFKDWPAYKYKQAANQIASLINGDPNADGVFLDLETYTPALLPFYSELAQDLKPHHKILSVIVRPGEENTSWFEAMGNNAFVVLYGYDLHQPEDSPLPVSPDIYQQRLTVAVNQLMAVAKKVSMPVMGGIPVVATTYEWEKKVVDVHDQSKNLEGAYRQVDYFKAALAVYNHIQSPLYLGFSIWAFLPDSNRFQTYFPRTISKEEWALF